MINLFKNIFPIIRLKLIQLLGYLKITNLLGLFLIRKLIFKRNKFKSLNFVILKKNNYYSNGYFNFGKKPIKLLNNWLGGTDLLINFNIHYFNYIHSCTDKDIKILLQNWLDNNNIHKNISKHPYVISRRIINLCIYYQNCNSNLDLIEKIIKKDYEDLIFKLEFRLCNNHLSSNLVALYFVINLFSSHSFNNLFNSFFTKHICSQILSDGCHLEQTPMYHHLFLQDIILVNELNKNLNIKNTKLLTVMNILNLFNKKLNPGLNECSFFNDSNNYEFISSFNLDNFITNNFQNYATTKINILKSHSGYYFVNYNKISFIFFNSEVFSKYNPGHHHSALLPFEVYTNQIKLITNSGIYDYNEGNKRTYIRSDLSKNSSYLGVFSFGIYKNFRIFYFPKLINFSFNNISNNCYKIKAYYRIGFFKKIKYKRTAIIKNNILEIFESSDIKNFKSNINSNKSIYIFCKKYNSLLSYNFFKFPYFYFKSNVNRYKLKTQNNRIFYKIKF